MFEANINVYYVTGLLGFSILCNAFLVETDFEYLNQDQKHYK